MYCARCSAHDGVRVMSPFLRGAVRRSAALRRSAVLRRFSILSTLLRSPLAALFFRAPDARAQSQNVVRDLSRLLKNEFFSSLRCGRGTDRHFSHTQVFE